MLYASRKNKPLIDIILLTYNNIENTMQCIDNLYLHTDNFGLIIWDNNSIDDTKDYLKKKCNQYDNITLFLSDSNIGIVNGRNSAYRLSKDTDYICFIDNDQFVSEGWLKSYLSFIEKGFNIVGAEGWKMNKNFYPYKKVGINETYNYVGCGGMVVRREVIEKIGLFDERFNPMYFEDPSFCWKAFLEGYKLCWNTDKKIYHKPHKLLGNNQERLMFFQKSHSAFQEKWECLKGRMPTFFNYTDTK